MSKNEVKNNNDIVEYADDYFEINFSADLPKELESILRKNPYSEQKDLDEVLSHIVILDEVKKQKNIDEKNLITENVDFSISYSENGKKVTENLSVPFGMGHFSKGIDHLREIGKAEYDKKHEKKPMDIKTQALGNPMNIDELGKNGWDTLDQAAQILNTISSPELAAFLKAISQEAQKYSQEEARKIYERKAAQEAAQKELEKQEKEQQKSKETSESSKEPSKDKEKSKQSQVSQKDIEAIKKQVKEIAQNLKKNNTRPKEINQHKTLGIDR